MIPMRFSFFLTLAGIASPLLAMFPWGVWHNTDTVITGFWLVSALSCLALLLRSQQKISLPLPIALWPLAALLAWSAFTLPVLDYPFRSWMGIAETGEGMAGYLSLLLFSLLSLPLLQTTAQRRILTYAACAIPVLLILFHLIGGERNGPYNYPDYLGMIGLCLTILFLTGQEKPSLKHALLAFLAGGCVIAFSNSLAAQAIILMAAACGVILYYGRKWLEKPWIRHLLATAIFLIPFLVLLLMWTQPATCNPSPGILAYDQPLCTRMLLAKLGIHMLIEQPSLLLTGAGWGGTSDLIARYLWLLPEAQLYHNGVWGPNWSVLQGDAFHTHHSVLEAILAAGLPAGLCLALVPALLAWASPAAHRIWLFPLWGGIALLQSLWFALPMTWPFYALALAASTTHLSTSLRSSAITTGLLLASCFALISSSVWQLHTMTRSMDLVVRLRQQQSPPDVPSLSAYLADGLRADRHLFWFAKQMTLIPHYRDIYGDSPRPFDLAWTDALLRETTATSSPRLQVQTADMLNQLCFYSKQPGWEELKARWCPSWPDYLVTLYQTMPLRSDLLIPHFQLLGQTNNTQALYAFAARIGQINPHDPVALWCEGMLRLLEGKKAEALPLLHTGMTSGATRLMPVTEEFAKSVESGVLDSKPF